jgi:Fe2+ or Zn2+ uptake regulation protein
MKSASDSKELIRSIDLKVTKNRLKVLEFLKFSAKPVTVEEVSDKLKINIVTAYRILEVFSSKGIIYQTDFRQNKAFFEFQEPDNHHHHITCSKCGFREHVHFCIGEKLTSDLEKDSSFPKIDSHILEFFGVCKKCHKK